MLKSYNATIATADTAVTLFTTETGYEALVVGLRLYGGANGGTVTLTKNDGSADVFAEAYTIGEGDVLSLNAKTAFPAGYSWKIQADATGIQADVCADVVAVS